jgi:outer membrane autotransporter protein
MQSWRSGSAGGASQGNAAYRVELASAQPDTELAQAVPGGGLWPPPPSAERRFAVWAQGFGLSGGRDGDAGVGSARLDYSFGGGASGFDAQLAPGLLVGASVAAAGSSFSLQGQPSSGTAHTIFFGLYGAWTTGPFYVDAAAGYGHGAFATTRTITVGATSELAQGNFDGDQYGGRVEAGWRFAVQRYRLTPFAGVAVQALHQDGYAESTTNTATNLPGTLGLSYAGQTTTSVRSFLGGETATTLQLDERTTLAPRIRVAWAHEYDRTRQVNASFLSLPGAAFTVNGARPARDAAIVVAGVDLAIGRNVALFAEFDGDIAGSGNAYAGSGGIRVSW